MSPLKIEVAGNTDVGRKRTHNEDNFLLFPEQKLFCVADGMGGHSSGEVASKIAVNEIASFFDDMPARLAVCHLFIGRSGASTVAELSVAGRPAIFVPYPGHTDQQQTHNAEPLEQKGGCLIIQ